MSKRDLMITKLERGAEGYWHCNVTVQGQTFFVHRKYGAWMHGDHDTGMREVLFPIAEAIQEKVRPIEKKERISREKAEGKHADQS